LDFSKRPTLARSNPPPGGGQLGPGSVGLSEKSKVTVQGGGPLSRGGTKRPSYKRGSEQGGGTRYALGGFSLVIFYLVLQIGGLSSRRDTQKSERSAKTPRKTSEAVECTCILAPRRSTQGKRREVGTAPCGHMTGYGVCELKILYPLILRAAYKTL